MYFYLINSLCNVTVLKITVYSMFAIAKLLVLTAGGGGGQCGGSSGPHRRPESVLGSNNGFRRVGNGAV